MMWQRRGRTTKARQAGQTLVEVLVAMGIAAIMLPALATALVASREGRAMQSQQLEARALLREADEAVRSVRERGWAGFAVNGTYRPVISGNGWGLAAGAETINGYTRQVVIADARRDAGGALVTSGGTVDPSTKRVTASVTWSAPFAASVASDTYLHRYRDNTSWQQTTQADFNAGTETNTAVSNASGGEVILAAGTGAPNWSSPTEIGRLNLAGNDDGQDVYVAGGYAYVADGSALSIITVADPAAPALTGTFTAAGAINGVYVAGNYAFLATAGDAAELVVVDISNKAAPSLVRNFDLAGTTDATSVAVDGGYAYVGKLVGTAAGVNEFHVINVTTPATPVLSGALNLAGTVNAVAVSGTMAYLATAIGTAELTIVNIATRTAPVQAGVYNAAGTSVANDVAVSGTTAYLVKAVNNAGAEFFILDAANPAAVALTGSHEANGTLNGVSVAGTQAYLATAINGSQLRILDITTPAAPTLTANFNAGSALNDVATDGTYAFVASTANAAEFEIVGGAVSASGYQTTGSFESATFAATATVGFNRLAFTATEPAGTDVRIQIASNDDNTTWNFVGPDGTAATYYSAAGPIPLNQAAGRYLRYRATLTGTGTETPALNDIRVDYAP